MRGRGGGRGGWTPGGGDAGGNRGRGGVRGGGFVGNGRAELGVGAVTCGRVLVGEGEGVATGKGEGSHGGEEARVDTQGGGKGRKR